MDTTEFILKKQLERVEKELEKVRGKEYYLPFGSMRRAKISRKWDMLAMKKRELQDKLSEYAH